jgi:hypothetical protein
LVVIVAWYFLKPIVDPIVQTNFYQNLGEIIKSFYEK